MSERFLEFRALHTMDEKAAFAKAAGIKITGKAVLLAIDMQNDFMEGGSLPVAGAKADAGRLALFLFEHAGAFGEVVATLDTHGMRHIFFPGWWEDATGNTVPPFTPISAGDLQSGKYAPVFEKRRSLHYVRGLEATAKYTLMVWPYHCLANTPGHNLEPNVADALWFYEASGGRVSRVFKGMDPRTEMYGTFQAEYPAGRHKNSALLKRVAGYDRIYIAGEAKSHCVLSTVAQLAAYMAEKGRPLSAIRILTDCMSAIAGFEEETEKALAALAEKGVVLTDTAHWDE